jgi:cytochrome P450
MSMTATPASLPPGSMGLPFLGETMAFGKNPFRFLEERQKRHGNVFKSSLFGRRIVFLAGTEGAEAFYDAQNISRADAHPFPLVQLFGGINLEMYDGPRHFALKSMALQAFDHAAIAGYLPDMRRLIEGKLAQLTQAGTFSAVAELRRLAIEVICGNVLGLAPGPETEAMTRDYGIVVPGLIALPLPGTTYGRALAARDRVLGRIRAVIAERRQRPGTDALSRVLTAKTADGRTYTDEEALLEVHHMVIAGFIVYALMAEAMRRLAEQPQLRARCVEEVRRHAASGPLTMEALGKLATATNVVLESKRHVPLVPLAFGRAQRTFTCGGFQVPDNWTVYLALSLNNFDRAVYTNPEKFDPDRFARGEHRKHPMAFIPQGAEPPTGHRCLGLDYATFLSLAFLTLLVRGYDWELPPQRLDYNWQKLPPEPRDGLRVRLLEKPLDGLGRR